MIDRLTDDQIVRLTHEGVNRYNMEVLIAAPTLDHARRLLLDARSHIYRDLQRWGRDSVRYESGASINLVSSRSAICARSVDMVLIHKDADIDISALAPCEMNSLVEHLAAEVLRAH